MCLDGSLGYIEFARNHLVISPEVDHLCNLEFSGCQTFYRLGAGVFGIGCAFRVFTRKFADELCDKLPWYPDVSIADRVCSLHQQVRPNINSTEAVYAGLEEDNLVD